MCRYEPFVVLPNPVFADRAVLNVQNNLKTLSGNATIKLWLYCISLTHRENIIGSRTNPLGADHYVSQQLSRALSTYKKIKHLHFQYIQPLCLSCYCYAQTKLTFAGKSIAMLHKKCFIM